MLLIVLWVHSYWYRDFVMGQHPDWGSGHAVSLQGKTSCLFDIYRRRVPRWKARFEIRSVPIEEAMGEMEGMEPVLPEGNSAGSFTIVNQPDVLGVVFPHWYLVLCTIVVGSAPWLRWTKRFSLRTLLIATTLVAVVLGLVVAIAR
jgi:hypothetical protein